MLDPDTRPEGLGDALEPCLELETEVEPCICIGVRLLTGPGRRVLRDGLVGRRRSRPLGNLGLPRLGEEVDDFGDQPSETIGCLVFL